MTRISSTAETTTNNPKTTANALMDAVNTMSQRLPVTPNGGAP